MYQERIITYRPWKGDPADLMTLNQAAEYLGISMETVMIRAQKGLMTLIENTDVPNRREGRNMVLRSEVEAWKQRREAV